MSGYMTSRDLQLVLEAQSMLRDRTIDLNLAIQCIKVARKIGGNFSDVLEDYDQAAALRARTGKLGELLSEAGLISEEELSEAMERSVNTGMPLGRMLVLNRILPGDVLQKALEVQVRLRDEVITREEAILLLRQAAGLEGDPAPQDKPEEKKQPLVRLGELLVMAGILNENDVMDALEWGLANQQPIGVVLVQQELISKELLDAALFFQNAVREGKFDAMKACELLSEVFSTGCSPEEALAEAAPDLRRKEPEFPPISYQQLLTLSRVVTDEEIENAFDLKKQNAALIGKVLVLTGRMDVPTLQATLRCFQMVAKGWLSPDDAIASLDYCLHQSPDTPLSFEQALRDLKWNPDTGLKMKGEPAGTKSGTNIPAVEDVARPSAEPAEAEEEELAPAAPEKVEVEEEEEKDSTTEEAVNGEQTEEEEESVSPKELERTAAEPAEVEVEVAAVAAAATRTKAEEAAAAMNGAEPVSAPKKQAAPNAKAPAKSEPPARAEPVAEEQPLDRETADQSGKITASTSTSTSIPEQAKSQDEPSLARALKSLYDDGDDEKDEPAEINNNASGQQAAVAPGRQTETESSAGGLKKLLNGLIAKSEDDGEEEELPLTEPLILKEEPTDKDEPVNEKSAPEEPADSRTESPKAKLAAEKEKEKKEQESAEAAELEDIARMSAEQLLVEIMKSAQNPDPKSATKRGGRFSETILPEDAKARQLAKLVGKESSKELAEKLAFDSGEEDTEAVDTAFGRLAETYFEQGNYKEAQVIYERMLVHRLNELGPDNPLLVEDYNNLAMTLCVQGRFDKAEPFMKRAVHLYESTDKQDPIEFADYLHSLGTIEYKLEKHKDAEEIMLKVVTIRRESLEEDHEDIGRALADYAKVLKKLGKDESAESIYKKAREILKKHKDS